MNVAKAHAFCATLPGATLDYKWRFEDSVHPVYSVGGKMFAMFSMKSEKLVDGVLFKADDARFLELTDREGIVPAPYLAKSKWVRLDRVARLADVELRALLTEAHATIVAKLSKKVQAALLGGVAASKVPTKRAPRARATSALAAPARKTAGTAGRPRARPTPAARTKR